ncbi:hypothetical protein [Helicobacter sp. T3_23-1056]
MLKYLAVLMLAKYIFKSLISPKIRRKYGVQMPRKIIIKSKRYCSQKS